MNRRLKLGILISGRGSNLQSIINAAKAQGFPAEINIVIANIPNVKGLEIAEKAGIRTKVIKHGCYDRRESFEDAIHSAMTKAQVDLICLAGFMRILTDKFVNRWPNKVINIHPSLLPSFKGLNTHKRAIKAGVKFSGCTVHFVRPEMDDGPIIIQSVVATQPEDTPETLASRVLIEEHKIYPLAIRLIAKNKISTENGLVKVKGAVTPKKTLTNPV